MAEKHKVQYKVIVVGQGSTGKTSIINRYTRGQFSKNYKVTVGVDFALKVLELEDCNVHLQLWDIAGQERYGSMTSVYYREAVAAIIVFDITNRKTFGTAEVWLKDLNDKLNTDPTKEPIPILLVANKTDLLKERPACVEDTELEQFVADNKFVGVFKTSAKDNDQISEAMQFLVQKIHERTPVKTVLTANVIHLNQNEQVQSQPSPAPSQSQSTQCCRN